MSFTVIPQQCIDLYSTVFSMDRLERAVVVVVYCNVVAVSCLTVPTTPLQHIWLLFMFSSIRFRRL